MSEAVTRQNIANGTPKVDAFVKCFNAHTTRELISNLETRVEYCRVGDLTLPITINSSGSAQNCYICDPVTGYVDYAKDELRHFTQHPILRSILNGLVDVSSILPRAAGLRDIVIVNNWLLSTNPAPVITHQTAREIRDKFSARFPDKVIAIRSLNTLQDQDTINVLKKLGFRMLPARQIYLLRADQHTQKPAQNTKRDLKLLQTTELQYVEHADFSHADFDRTAELYGMLYLKKYTPLNPQYTGLYMKEMHDRGVIEFHGLRDHSGQLVAVTGFFSLGKTLTQPIVGYDTSRSIDEGIYRMLMAIAQRKADNEGLVYNGSAGAAHFKRLRHLVPTIEYTAMFDHHLPLKRKLSIIALERILRTIGIPLLKRFEL